MLIAGGIGITPVRALLERCAATSSCVYRVVRDEESSSADELESLAAQRGATVHFVVGDHATRRGRRLLSPDHLRELVPDLAERDVYVCGPPAMTTPCSNETSARAGVPARNIHVERFAL